MNSAHAIGECNDGGKAGKGRIVVSTVAVGEVAEIRVADTGGGIADAVKDKILDPFFTTRAVGKGTGQGLAIARNVVVDEHGGTIDFVANDTGGTTFVVRLPFKASENRDRAA